MPHRQEHERQELRGVAAAQEPQALVHVPVAEQTTETGCGQWALNSGEGWPSDGHIVSAHSVVTVFVSEWSINKG